MQKGYMFVAYKLVEKIAIISLDFSRKFGFSLNGVNAYIMDVKRWKRFLDMIYCLGWAGVRAEKSDTRN